MALGQHTLVQDTRNQNAAAFLPVENDVAAVLKTLKSRADFIAEAAQ